MDETRIMVIVPFPFDETGLEGRREQLDPDRFGPGVEVEFKPVKSSCALADSHHDYLLLDAAIYEAGIEAENEGFDAVCIDTVTDSGMDALRSRLSIPVVGPGQGQFHVASLLGEQFAVLTQWDQWIPIYKKTARQYGFREKLCSIRSIDVRPDVEMLLSEKKETIFPRLREEGLKAIEEDGADVLCMGSTTMHQSVAYLQEELPVPVLNPGLTSYKLAELLVSLDLSQSSRAYPSPEVPMDDKFHHMFDSVQGRFKEFTVT